jgi:hypothetical protein
MHTDPTAIQRIQLMKIRYAIDAITAAVRGSDFNDKSQQRGIIHLLGEQYCQLGEVIDEMGGEIELQDEA